MHPWATVAGDSQFAARVYHSHHLYGRDADSDKMARGVLPEATDNLVVIVNSGGGSEETASNN